MFGLFVKEKGHSGNFISPQTQKEQHERIAFIEVMDIVIKERHVTLQQALDFIFVHFDPQLYRVLNVYLFGSRVYKCNTPDSDFDLIVIVEGEPYFGQSVMIENEDMNINIYHKDFFKDILEQHLIAMVLCVFLPSEYVWMETFKFPFELKKINLKRAALQGTSWIQFPIFSDGSHNLAKGRRLWSEGDKKKAKKNVVHGLRYLDFAMQLAKQNCIHSVHNGNKYWDEIMDCEVDEWNYYEQKYRPLYQEIFHFLEHNVPPPPIPQSREFTENLRTIEFIRSFGLARLRKEFSIECKPSPRYNGLYLLSANPVFSPAEHPIVRECWHGLIIQKTVTEDSMDDDVLWKVISCPFFKWFEYDSLFAHKLSENASAHNITVSEKIDGYLMTMYYFDQQWFVASRDSLFHGEPVPLYYHSKISFRSHLNVRPFVEDPLKIQHTSWNPPQLAPPALLNERFWEIWKNLNYKFPSDTDMCYVFEMVFPGLKGSMVNHNRDMIYLVGARNVNTMEQIDVSLDNNPQIYFNSFGWVVPTTTTFSGLHDLVSKCMLLNPFQHEGYVICASSTSNSNSNNNMHGDFERISVKAQLHCEMKMLAKENTPLWRADIKTNHRILTNIIRVTTYQKLIQPDSANADQLFLGLFPQWQEMYEQSNQQFQNFLHKVKTAHESLKAVTDRKQFASSAKKYPFYGCLFEFRDSDPPEQDELIPTKYFAFCRYKLLSKWMSANK